MASHHLPIMPVSGRRNDFSESSSIIDGPGREKSLIAVLLKAFFNRKGRRSDLKFLLGFAEWLAQTSCGRVTCLVDCVDVSDHFIMRPSIRFVCLCESWHSLRCHCRLYSVPRLVLVPQLLRLRSSQEL